MFNHRKLFATTTNNKLLFFLSVILLTTNFITLPISPLPWFDETFFADISINTIIKCKPLETSIFDVDSLGKGENFFDNKILVYGPVYFYVTGVILKLLGIGIIQFRIISFLASITLCYITSLLISNRKNQLLFFISILTVPIVISSGHGGRMDTLALTMVLVSYFPFVKKNFDYSEIHYRHVFSSGLFALIAILTTPRCGFLLIPFGLVILYSFIIKINFNSLSKIILWTITIGIGLLSWIYYGFGGFDRLIIYFKAIASTGEGVSVDNKIYIPKFQIPLIILTTVSILARILKKKSFNKIDFISLFNIFFFYTFIKDTGPYSVFIIPFYFLILYNSYSSLQKFLKLNGRHVLWVILSINLVFYIFKISVVFSQYEIRKSDNIDNFISKTIPQESKVIGDEIYFYACKKNNNEFKYIHLYNTLKNRELIQRKRFDYDYIIWSDNLDIHKKEIIDYYKQFSDLKVVGRYELINESIFNTLLKKLNVKILDSYNCTVYERMKE